ncbi:MAG: FecR domain-containing protein [Photobacterium frigidiphilum]|uniref:FecR family protein n=1 Tax=Photobacterium frigidiphilum TaxID=264736 RepID=UPI003002CC77
MKTQDSSHRSSEDWFAKHLSGELSSEEQSAFQNWLAHPINAKEYEQTTDAWQQALFAKDYFSKVAMPKASQSQSHWRKGFIAIAATIIIGLLMTVTLTKNNEALYTEELATGIGKRAQHTLVDGSTIEMSVNTKLTVNYDKEVRNISLHQGEAYFDVSHDNDRLFNIFTNGHKISVLGTKFNVKVRDDSTEVVLIEGSVQINSSSKETHNRVMLKPGQKSTFSISSPPSPPVTTETQMALAWRSGKAVFIETPLKEVLDNLRDYDHTSIIIAPSAASLLVSGVIPIENHDIALNTLSTMLPITIKLTDKGYMVERKP